MVAMLSSSPSSAPTLSRRAGTKPTALARVAYAGHLTRDELELVEALMLRLYGAGLEPLGYGPADVLVVGRRPYALTPEDLGRAQPRRVLLVVRREDHRAELDAARWKVALPDAHVLTLELDALRDLGIEAAARVSRVSLAACWGAPRKGAALPLLPTTPPYDA
jgi:hypothetical protein